MKRKINYIVNFFNLNKELISMNNDEKFLINDSKKDAIKSKEDKIKQNLSNFLDEYQKLYSDDFKLIFFKEINNDNNLMNQLSNLNNIVLDIRGSFNPYNFNKHYYDSKISINLKKFLKDFNYYSNKIQREKDPDMNINFIAELEKIKNL